MSALAGLDPDLVLPLLSSTRTDAVVGRRLRAPSVPRLEPIGFDEAVRRALSATSSQGS